jgi:DNA replication protein
MAEAKEIQQLARILNLQNIASGEIDLNDEKLSNKDYIYNILLQEVNIRNANKLKDIRKQARLPKKVFDKTRIIEGLKWQLDKLSSFDFSTNKQNIFIVGDCSTRKTSLAVTIGNDAIEKGFRIL